MFYTQFASASPRFIEYIQQTNLRLVSGMTKGSVRDNSGALSLSYAKADSHKLFQFMYHNDNCLSLTRKKLKLTSFVYKDRVGIITKS